MRSYRMISETVDGCASDVCIIQIWDDNFFIKSLAVMFNLGQPSAVQIKVKYVC